MADGRENLDKLNQHSHYMGHPPSTTSARLSMLGVDPLIGGRHAGHTFRAPRYPRTSTIWLFSRDCHRSWLRCPGARRGQHLFLPPAAADRSAAEGLHRQDRHQDQRRLRRSRPQRAPRGRRTEQPRRSAFHRRCRPSIRSQGCRPDAAGRRRRCSRTQFLPSSAIPTTTGSASPCARASSMRPRIA